MKSKKSWPLPLRDARKEKWPRAVEAIRQQTVLPTAAQSEARWPVAPGSRSLFRNAADSRAPGLLRKEGSFFRRFAADQDARLTVIDEAPYTGYPRWFMDFALACLESFRMRPCSWPA